MVILSIYVTGDIHGYPIRLSDESLKENGIPLSKNDKLIVCGDFGLPWYNDFEDIQCLEWLSQKTFEILFVDGNHENFDLLNKFPVCERYGGKVHVLRNNIFHLMRGEVYEIEDKTFLAFGGATSADKYLRVEHIDWWTEEVSNEEEQSNAIRNLERVNFNVDYVITHTAPIRFVDKLSVHSQNASECPVVKFLDEISERLEWRRWYFGHFHIDFCVNETVCCLCEDKRKV